MARKIQIAASILSADFAQLGNEIAAVEAQPGKTLTEKILAYKKGAIAALGILFACFSASAQTSLLVGYKSPGPSLWPGITNSIAANSTNVLGLTAVIADDLYDKVGVTIYAQCNTNCTGNVVFRVAQDATQSGTITPETVPSLVAVAPLNGTNLNISITEWYHLGGIPHLCGFDIQNTNNAAITNFSIAFYFRSNKRGNFPATR